jgi:hypothetical protein
VSTGCKFGSLLLVGLLLLLLLPLRSEACSEPLFFSG